MKLLSIIIPCYNADKTLANTLNSVKEQSNKNLEIIIVNDGSTDNTLQIANKYASIDVRFKVVSQNNAGVSVARNTGLSMASGDYIMFLDADDNYTTPFAIQNMCNQLEKTHADMCVCNFTHPCFEQHLKPGIYDLTNHEQFLCFFQDFFAFGVPWNKLIKRDCITEWFEPNIKFNEDELFNLDNLHNIKKVVVVDEVYHNYYCAPYNPNMPASAVNSIYSQKEFWKNKSTIWHLGMKNHDYRINSLKKFFPEMLEELKYVRSFDFFFWDFFLMAKNRVKEEYVFETCKSIFKTELFQNTLKAKELYGLKLKEISDDEIKEFVKFAYIAFIDIKTNNKKLSMYKVFLGLFTLNFYEIVQEINSCDILSQSATEQKNLISAESYYVNALLELNKIENNA